MYCLNAICTRKNVLVCLMAVFIYWMCCLLAVFMYIQVVVSLSKSILLDFILTHFAQKNLGFVILYENSHVNMCVITDVNCCE